MTTTHEDLQSRLMKLASQRFGRDLSSFGPDDDFFDVLGVDSYQAMELLTDLERTFDVEIPDYELKGVSTFRGLAEVLRRRL